MSLYLIAYLAIGVCVLLAFLFAGRRANGEWISLKTELARGTPFDPGDWKHWVEVNFLGAILPPVFTVVGIVGWPMLICAKVHDSLAHRARNNRETFHVKRRDLICKMTIQEIERVELVFDPLSAVPPVPFGFLNPAWQRFAAGLKPTDTIWSFSTRWKSGFRNEERAGFAVLRGRKIGPHFVTAVHEVSTD